MHNWKALADKYFGGLLDNQLVKQIKTDIKTAYAIYENCSVVQLLNSCWHNFNRSIRELKALVRQINRKYDNIINTAYLQGLGYNVSHWSRLKKADIIVVLDAIKVSINKARKVVNNACEFIYTPSDSGRVGEQHVIFQNTYRDPATGVVYPSTHTVYLGYKSRTQANLMIKWLIENKYASRVAIRKRRRIENKECNWELKVWNLSTKILNLIKQKDIATL